MKTYDQNSPEQSPWSLRQRVAMLLWEYCWIVFCVWTPKPANAWRLFWLRLFGATIHGVPFVHQRARIQIPWNLALHDRSCLGDRTNAYSLGEIEVGPGAVVAKEAYLCTGTHDLTDPNLPLQVATIVIGEGAFVGARAFIMPGIVIGKRAIVGACSVVTKTVAEGEVVAGNPAQHIRLRESGEPDQS